MFKKIVSFLGVTVLVLALACPSAAEAATKKKATKKKTKSRPRAARVVPAPVFSGKYSALVIDARTGRILQEENSTAIRHPASLTKMMTIYLTFQALEAGVVRLDTQLPVSALAAAQSPSKLGLRAGQTISVYDAILGLVTESANDAAIALAEGLGGSVGQFAELMNKQARALGMERTHFINPNGLPDDEQVTTARDMAVLGYGLIYHYPGFYPYFSKTSFRYAGRVHTNHNRLMQRYDGMDGIKTGYIRASGFNLVSSAERANTRLIGVVFGGTSAPARDNQMARLMDNGFEKIRYVQVSSRSAQGSVSGDDPDYIALPSKVAVVFGGTRMPAPQRQTNVPPARGQENEAVVSSGGWGVQIGAFSEVGGAQQALAVLGQNAGTLLHQAEPSLQKLTMSDGSVVYRARYIGMDQQTARAVCSYMIRRGQGCMVVSGL